MDTFKSQLHSHISEAITLVWNLQHMTINAADQGQQLPTDEMMTAAIRLSFVSKLIEGHLERWQLWPKEQPGASFPSYCGYCGVPLMGGATRHQSACAIQAIIDGAFPADKPDSP